MSLLAKPRYGMRHRKLRHHLAGIEHLRKLRGDQAATAARLHIIGFYVLRLVFDTAALRLSRIGSVEIRERGRLDRRLRRPAEDRLSQLMTHRKVDPHFPPKPVGGTPTGGDRDGRATLLNCIVTAKPERCSCFGERTRLACSVPRPRGTHSMIEPFGATNSPMATGEAPVVHTRGRVCSP